MATIIMIIIEMVQATIINKEVVDMMIEVHVVPNIMTEVLVEQMIDMVVIVHHMEVVEVDMILEGLMDQEVVETSMADNRMAEVEGHRTTMIQEEVIQEEEEEEEEYMVTMMGPEGEGDNLEGMARINNDTTGLSYIGLAVDISHHLYSGSGYDSIQL